MEKLIIAVPSLNTCFLNSFKNYVHHYFNFSRINKMGLEQRLGGWKILSKINKRDGDRLFGTW